MRYLQPVADYQQAGAVTDPTTRMTFGYLLFTDTRANKIIVTLECLHGFAPDKTDAQERIVKPYASSWIDWHPSPSLGKPQGVVALAD
jgi:hypothetical protein